MINPSSDVPAQSTVGKVLAVGEHSEFDHCGQTTGREDGESHGDEAAQRESSGVTNRQPEGPERKYRNQPRRQPEPDETQAGHIGTRFTHQIAFGCSGRITRDKPLLQRAVIEVGHGQPRPQQQADNGHDPARAIPRRGESGLTGL